MVSGLLGKSRRRQSKEQELREILLIKLTAKAHPESGLMRDHRATYGSGTVSRVIEQLVRDGYASRESGQVELTRKGKTYTVIR